MDTTQLFLTFILILSTLFLIGVGVQLFFALRDFRKTLTRVNSILDTVDAASQELELGIKGVVGFFDGFQSLLKTLEIINLLSPLHDYLKRKHATSLSAKHQIQPKSTNGIHALIDKMRTASQKKQERFITKSTPVS